MKQTDLTKYNKQIIEQNTSAIPDLKKKTISKPDRKQMQENWQ